MRNIASCYNEHAIKVTDSYCSNPSNQVLYHIPSVQNVVTCIYKVKIATEKQFLVKITWCTLLEHGFSISTSDKFTNNFKKVVTIDKSKGSKTAEFFCSRFNVCWDLSNAIYESGPEPINGYFVKVLVNSEVGLSLGDMVQEIEQKKSNLDDKFSRFVLVSRSEHFSGSSVFATKAKFCDTGTCHDIVIKCSTEDENRFKNSSSMLFVSIDKKSVIHVKRLQWNFRGNQTIFVDGLVVDLMWDVHDWLFNSKTGCAMFMFRTRSGLDSRLWLEEKNLEQKGEERVEFSLLICASKNPD